MMKAIFLTSFLVAVASAARLVVRDDIEVRDCGEFLQ